MWQQRQQCNHIIRFYRSSQRFPCVNSECFSFLMGRKPEPSISNTSYDVARVQFDSGMVTMATVNSLV